jgi:protein required for attachment to host cells
MNLEEEAMPRICIVVADATRARLFTYEHVSDGGGTHEAFSERTDLVNLARRETPSELFSDTRTNTNRAAGGRHFGYDDHRDAHIDRLDEEFSREIARAIDRAVRETGATRLIVCAPPRMLGMLRATALRRDGLAIDEVAHDYTKLGAAQVRDQLVERELLPARPRAGLAL